MIGGIYIPEKLKWIQRNDDALYSSTPIAEFHIFGIATKKIGVNGYFSDGSSMACYNAVSIEFAKKLAQARHAKYRGNFLKKFEEFYLDATEIILVHPDPKSDNQQMRDGVIAKVVREDGWPDHWKAISDTNWFAMDTQRFENVRFVYPLESRVGQRYYYKSFDELQFEICKWAESMIQKKE